METFINSKQNKFYKLAKSLKFKKYRQEYALYMLEGVKQVFHGTNIGIYPNYLFIADSKRDSIVGMSEYRELVSSLKTRVYLLSDELFEGLSDTKNSQGIIALFDMNLKPIHSSGIDMVILDRVQDPGNMGSIIRNADAFGISDIYLLKGCVDAYSQKVLRSAMGSFFNVNIHEDMDIEDVVEIVKSRNVKVLLSDLSASNQSFDIRNEELDSGYALVLGNESNGISKSWYDFEHEAIKIPMCGSAQSLNVAMASAILMYEMYLSRSRSKIGGGQSQIQ